MFVKFIERFSIDSLLILYTLQSNPIQFNLVSVMLIHRSHFTCSVTICATKFMDLLLVLHQLFLSTRQHLSYVVQRIKYRAKIDFTGSHLIYAIAEESFRFPVELVSIVVWCSNDSKNTPLNRLTYTSNCHFFVFHSRYDHCDISITLNRL